MHGHGPGVDKDMVPKFAGRMQGRMAVVEEAGGGGLAVLLCCARPPKRNTPAARPALVPTTLPRRQLRLLTDPHRLHSFPARRLKCCQRSASPHTRTCASRTQVTHVFGYPRNLPERYMLGKVIGAGSFGVVRECVHIASNRVFAIKTIPKVPKRGMPTPRYLLKLRTEVGGRAEEGTEGPGQISGFGLASSWAAQSHSPIRAPAALACSPNPCAEPCLA